MRDVMDIAVEIIKDDAKTKLASHSAVCFHPSPTSVFQQCLFILCMLCLLCLFFGRSVLLPNNPEESFLFNAHGSLLTLFFSFFFPCLNNFASFLQKSILSTGKTIPVSGLQHLRHKAKLSNHHMVEAIRRYTTTTPILKKKGNVFLSCV